MLSNTVQEPSKTLYYKLAGTTCICCLSVFWPPTVLYLLEVCCTVNYVEYDEFLVELCAPTECLFILP